MTFNVQIPSEEELAERIKDHLLHGSSREGTTISLNGFLAGLTEFSLISGEAYSRLRALLPSEWGKTQALELFLGPEGAKEYLQSEKEEQSENKEQSENQE